MTINSLSYVASTPITGLGTQTYNVTVAGIYQVSFNINIPYNPAGSSNNSSSTVGQSGLQVVVNQNGSPVLTVGGSATNPTPTQPSLSGACHIQAALNDVITVVLSSANAVDNYANVVKGIVNVYQGE